MAEQQNLVRANAEGRYEVTAADLPLHCPMDNMTKWDSHPRVFLPMDKGSAICPYCSAEYVLVGDAPKGH